VGRDPREAQFGAHSYGRLSGLRRRRTCGPCPERLRTDPSVSRASANPRPLTSEWHAATTRRISSASLSVSMGEGRPRCRHRRSGRLGATIRGREPAKPPCHRRRARGNSTRAPSGSPRITGPSPAATAAARRPRLSTERRGQLKRQGEYIGSMRGLPVGKKARVKREREVRGIEAAIQLARKLAKA
jgi:hypothetical protein